MNLNIKINVDLALKQPTEQEINTAPLALTRNESFYGQKRISFKRYSYTMNDEYKQAVYNKKEVSKTMLQIPKVNLSEIKQMASLQSDNQILKQKASYEHIPMTQTNHNMAKLNSLVHSNNSKQNICCASPATPNTYLNDNKEKIDIFQTQKRLSVNDFVNNCNQVRIPDFQKIFSFSQFNDINNESKKVYEHVEKGIVTQGIVGNLQKESSYSILKSSFKRNANISLETVINDVNNQSQQISPFAQQNSGKSQQSGFQPSLTLQKTCSLWNKPEMTHQESLRSIKQVSFTQDVCSLKKSPLATEHKEHIRFSEKHVPICETKEVQCQTIQPTLNTVFSTANKQFGQQNNLNGFNQNGISCENEPSSQELVIQNQAESGRANQINRHRKKEWQISVLRENFHDDLLWTLEDKIRLGKQIGMTYHQVSKWHWDERKKRGIDTRKRSVKETQKINKKAKY